MTDKRFKWWLYKDLVVSEAAFKMFYADDKNRNKWYKPKTDDTKQDEVLVNLLLVPRGMVKWLTNSPRTPMEYHDELLRVFGGTDPAKRPDALTFSLLWTRVDSIEHTTQTTRSSTELVLEEVFGDTPALSAWLSARLATTMGAVTTPAAPQQIVIMQQPAGPPP